MKRNHLFLLPVLCLAMLSCGGGKLQLEAKVDTKLEVKKEVKAEVKKEEPKEEPKAEPPGIEEVLTAAVNGDHRPAEDKARDPYRHPVETLSFFGLKQNMTVLEIAPGQGWYTRILAPVLKDEGKLIVTSVDTTKDVNSEATQSALAYQSMLEQNKNVFGDVQIQVVKKDNKLGEPDSVDMVLSFRNNHFWAKAKRQEAKIYKAIFNVLKPGGVFGMVHHRANPDAKVRQALNKGYLPEQYVIDRALAAGFELVEKSEVNANPKDTKDYQRGVWSLPPVLAFGEKDRDRYLEIGESDRMTLLFRKPVAKNEPNDTPAAEEKVEAKKEVSAEVKDENKAEKVEKAEPEEEVKEAKKEASAEVKDENKAEKAKAEKTKE
ncbi:MAG: class I SAM-dependent methyltransferase [Deltaproteobacteria bacterium]|nr:class I SAM-dependent methyltransferase [Deltaproteobacteria bacterium]MBN2671017.1 class I SAM-dependent methyltransferase [Deltaproteobacteria bacterium]